MLRLRYFLSSIPVMPAIAAHIPVVVFILVSHPVNNLSSIINTSNPIFRKQYGQTFYVSYKETEVLKWNSKFLIKCQTLDLT